MKLQAFLQKCGQFPLWQSERKICFIVPDKAPVLFFVQLLQSMRVAGDNVVERIDFQAQEESHILSRLETVGFLTCPIFYWLGNISELSAKKRKEWLAYIDRYQGPHALGLCLSLEESQQLGKKWLMVDTPPVVDRAEFELLAQFFYPQKIMIYKRLSRYFTPAVKVTLDQSTLLLEYGQVLGNNIQQFCDEWLPMLIESEQSLFKVSEYFLSKRSVDFFKLWAKVGSCYPEVFWVSFWSDTLWRAYNYTIAMQHHDDAEAKRMSYKLPFSFIKGGWRKVNPEQLKDAHKFLYNFDFNLKNSAADYFYGLELLYAKFFSEEFVPVNGIRREYERCGHCSSPPVI